MRSILFPLILVLTFACSGGGGSSPAPAPGPTPPPAAPKPVPRGTYRATASSNASPVAVTPMGDIAQTFIVQDGGLARMELSGWYQAFTSISADANGVLQISPDARLTNAEGVTVPLTLTGTMVGNRMTGVTNGGAFDVTLTGIQDTPVDMATKAGTWISTASSNGQVLRLTLPAVLNSSFNMTADAYATPADAAAGTNRLGVYSGTMGWTDDAHLRNVFNFGLIFQPTGAGSPLPGGTYGFAYFTETGSLVVLTSHVYSSAAGAGQLSAIFTKE